MVFDPFGDFQTEIVDYSARCNELDKSTGKCHGYVTGARTTYKVQKERAEVVYWLTDNSNPVFGLRKLTNCTIRNAGNWSCVFSDGSGLVVVSDGIPNRQGMFKDEYVSLRSYQWWFLRALSFLAGSIYLPPILIPTQHTCDLIGPRRLIHCERSPVH